MKSTKFWMKMGIFRIQWPQLYAFKSSMNLEKKHCNYFMDSSVLFTACSVSLLSEVLYACIVLVTYNTLSSKCHSYFNYYQKNSEKLPTQSSINLLLLCVPKNLQHHPLHSSNSKCLFLLMCTIQEPSTLNDGMLD